MFKNENLVIVDVGANEGQTINFFHRLNKKNFLYSFEPNPTLFKILKKKYKNNKNVKLFQKGVSDLSTTRTFYENILHESSTFEKLNMSSKYLKKKSIILGVKPSEIISTSYPVKVINLNEFLNKEGIIIVDDAWRYPSILNKSKAKKILRLESTGPCRFGVTRTDLHFY